MSSQTVLILGAGGNTGVAVAKKFKSQGWHVATVSRSAAKDPLTQSTSLHIQADFASPNAVADAYQRVERELGIPNVVIYNAYAATFAQDQKHPFDSVSVEKFAEDLNVNVTSAYAALKSAIGGFERLAGDAIKVFIYTGNMSTGIIVPETMTLGVGKNAILYLVESTVQNYGHLARFYFGDERDPDGNSTMDKIDGEAHGVAYWELATSPQQGPINYTFVKGAGYKKFDVDRASRPVEGVHSLMKKAADAVAARGGS